MHHLPTHPTLTHPLTGQPLQALGVTRSGRIIWPVLGGSEDAGGGSGQGQDSTTGPADVDTGQDQQETKAPNIKGDLDPDRAARAIASAREAERKAKEKARAADERLAAILKAAGLTPDGKEDPADQLKAAREAADKATARARQIAVELAVYKSAGKAGADPDAVLDSRGFLAEVSELDPEAKNFADQVVDAMKKALKANPRLAASAGQGPGKQGADHNGGGGQVPKAKNLTEAITARLGG